MRDHAEGPPAVASPARCGYIFPLMHNFRRPRALTSPMRVVVLALAGACAGLALVLPAGAPAADRTLIVTPSPVVVPAGAPVIISGRLVGDDSKNREVTLSRDPFPYGDGFKQERSTRTDRDGQFRFSRPADENANFRVRSGDQVADVVVRVQYRIAVTPSTMTPRKRQWVRFNGTVSPPSTGFARLQRRTSAGPYVTVRSVRLVAPVQDCPQPPEPTTTDPGQPTTTDPTQPTTTVPATAAQVPVDPGAAGPGGAEPTGQAPDPGTTCKKKKDRSGAAQAATYSMLIPVFFTGNYRVVVYYDGKHVTSFSPVKRLTVVPGTGPLPKPPPPPMPASPLPAAPVPTTPTTPTTP